MQRFFVGGDVSKGYADFVILDPRKRVAVPNFQLDDTFDGHARLYHILERFSQDHPKAQLFAAVESTGGYEDNWLHGLRRFQASLPLRVARLNPAGVHQYARAEGTRVTTDAVSAEHVAGYQIAHGEKIDYEQDDALADVRSYWTFIEQMIKQHTALVNQLETLLYRAHPQLLTYLTNGAPQWILKLVERYPTAERLARARVSALAKIPYLRRERATKLIADAKQSVASASGPATEQLLSELARQILHLDELITSQKKALSAQLDLPEEVELLKSFGSIADYSAVGLLLEIQTVLRFPSAKKLASFFGVHPAFKTSGDGTSKIGMSKHGSPRMRALLFMITLNAIQRNPVIASLYERLQEQGMAKMAAIGVCMHKTLRILYGMLKSGLPFDPDVERRHRQRTHTRKPNTAVRRTRRYQAYDEEAPISARAQKRRQQQKHSQSELVAVCGMSISTAASQNKREDSSKSLVKEQLKST